MTVRRLLAIAVIFVGSAVAWFALGSSVLYRTGEFDDHLRQQVTLLWGGPHVQRAPDVAVARPTEVTETVVENVEGAPMKRDVTRTLVTWIPAPILATRADVTLDLEHRQKGLLWYDTYEVAFAATYVIENPDDVERRLRITFAFPAEHAIYDNFVLTIDGTPAPREGDLAKEIQTSTMIPPRGRVTLAAGYQSRGLGDWRYAFSKDSVTEVRDFLLALRTNFRDIDFPPGTVSPSERTEEGGGWRLTWRFANLVTGQAVGVDLPEKLNPGPIAARITFFAPVALLFFLTVMVMLDVLANQSLHPMNYFFISAAFFAFHLLLAYLVDHISVHLAFAIAAAVSLGLVASYLRVAAGLRGRLLHAAAAQAIYLVAFSYAFFFEGLTGLTVTIGAVITLFVLMQMTARVRWADVFAKPSERVPPVPAS